MMRILAQKISNFDGGNRNWSTFYRYFAQISDGFGDNLWKVIIAFSRKRSKITKNECISKRPMTKADQKEEEETPNPKSNAQNRSSETGTMSIRKCHTLPQFQSDKINEQMTISRRLILPPRRRGFFSSSTLNLTQSLRLEMQTETKKKTQIEK